MPTSLRVGVKLAWLTWRRRPERCRDPTPSRRSCRCRDLDASEAFYARLGFIREKPAAYDDYRILSDGKGGALHLTPAVPGWLERGRNPFGLYLTTEEVDRLAEAFRGETLERGGPEHKPWGMYEFSLSDPDETLVRVGWPSSGEG